MNIFKRLENALELIFICSWQGHNGKWIPVYENGVQGGFKGYEKRCVRCRLKLSSEKEERKYRKKEIERRKKKINA